MSKLRIRNGPMAGRERTLGEQPVTIGRDAEAGVQILDRSASRFHAEVFPVGGMFFVRDLDSKNGTHVNDNRLLDEELLREGDVIKIGTTELVYESGIALSDDESSDRVAWQDDAEMLSNTLEFRIDDLSDLQDQQERSDASESHALKILYQVGRIVGKSAEHEVSAKVLDFLIEAMPAESALIFLRQVGSGKLVPHTVRSLAPQGNPVISRTIIRRTVSENRAFFTADAQDDERLNRKDSVVHKGIRSVVCVPLTVAGATRGVLYLSRGIGGKPFDQADLELLSACAVHLGLAYQAAEMGRKQRQLTWDVLSTMVAAMEGRAGLTGTGDRTARVAVALARALRLSPEATWRLQVAGLLHHVPSLCCNENCPGEQVFAGLAGHEGLEELLPLLRNCRERLDGTGPRQVVEADLDTEMRILAVAAAFEQALAKNPDADVMKVIAGLAKDDGLDDQVVAQLKACHMKGALYEAVES